MPTRLALALLVHYWKVGENTWDTGLRQRDLVVDAIYTGGRSGTSGDDPISKLLPVGNMGGFRYTGKAASPKFVVLVTSGADPDWPDVLDPQVGLFTYYGDNRAAGKQLHDTKGNVVLRNMFDAAQDELLRLTVPPTFIFSKAGPSRDYRYLGLAVPGTADSEWFEQLVALWRTSDSGRFQNYRAHFTILDAAVAPRAWLDSLSGPDPLAGPEAWELWRHGGVPRALVAPRPVDYRSRDEQRPTSELHRRLVEVVHQHFGSNPHAFELLAADITRWYLGNVTSIEMTRPSRDGGRDGIGKLAIGSGPSGISIDFALEAKCYGWANSVGVKELSRLISRLRHRQFGVLVTTSYLNLQAYQELKEDQHPIIVISAREVAETLVRIGKSEPTALRTWLTSNYPTA